MQRSPSLLRLVAFGLALAGCEGELARPPAETDRIDPSDGPSSASELREDDRFPPEFEAVEGGYPSPDAPCRRLGDTIATANWRTEGEILFGCPSFADVAALKGGRAVEKVGGITLVSVPLATVQSTLAAQGRTLAAARGYDARASIPCGIGTPDPQSRCMAGVIRAIAAGTPGRLEIQRPDGEVRAFLVESNRILGIDPTMPPQSPEQAFALSRTGTDEPSSRLRFGGDVFIVPDSLLVVPPTSADATTDVAPAASANLTR